MKPRRLDYTIPAEDAGKKVSIVARYIMGLSGTVLRRIKWLEDGILLDGTRVTTRERVQVGQVLSVRLSDPTPETDIPPVPLPLNIVYEDRDIVVVDKAAGMPSHPSAGHWNDSLGNALVAWWRESDPFATFHPVHRLDKGTSGLMVVAKHPFAQEVLKQQLHTPDFQREYLAICDAIPTPSRGTINVPIAQADSSVLKREVAPDGLRAVTHYEVVRTHQQRALVHLRLETGRTHQIRVHMAHMGWALTGDFLYGVENQALITRPALHSCRLTLKHPVTGAQMTWTAPLPADMKHLL